MSVLVDTTIWSLVLRRAQKDRSHQETACVEAWRALVRDGDVSMLGVIRQEVLSGVRGEATFERLREHLEDFEDIPCERIDHERAAKFYNVCRGKGVAGTHIDMLICAVASRRKLRIFTTDKDFVHYARVLDVRLYSVS